MNIYELHSDPEQLIWNNELSNTGLTQWSIADVNAILALRTVQDIHKLTLKWDDDEDRMWDYDRRDEDAPTPVHIMGLAIETFPHWKPMIQEYLLTWGHILEVIGFAIWNMKERWPEAEKLMYKHLTQPDLVWYQNAFDSYADAFGVDLEKEHPDYFGD